MPYIGKSPSAGVRQRYQYTATAGQTTFSGTDLGNLTLTYTDNNFVDVFQNGVLLKGGGTDYTATSGTSVVLATGASVSDVIEIIVYDVFSVGNFFNRTDSDSRYVNVDGDTMTGEFKANGGAVFNEDSADVDFRVESNGDTHALFVDAGNDKVGVFTSSPNAKLAVSGTGTVDLGIGSTNAGGAYLYLDGDSNGDFSGSDYSYIGHDTSGQLLIHQDSPSGSDNILFKTNATERMKIDSSGDVTVTDGDLIIGTSGHGISFAATSDGTSMTSELLDDYEEGKIAAPVVKIGGTVCTIGSSNGLFYTKIGRKVLVSVEFRITNKNGGSGTVTVDLPYASVSNNYTTGAVRIYNGTVNGREFAEIQSAESVIKFTQNNDGGATTAMDIPLNAYIFTSLFYTT